MDIRKVKKLIEMLEASDVMEIEIREGEESVRISRYQAAHPVMPSHAPVVYGHSSPTTTVSHENSPPPPDNTTTPANPHSEHVITSPMVGTFYRSASPTTKPFVEEGTQVNEGDTICIIEAMKILNQITAERTGVIKKVLVENGAPVEYGQPLFVML
ncbi:acetyl-CoA carboxylase biotin carboxyl carrier protein [Thioflexithrix psekupsensis]|uniref:Biotin carboxyl carrier protein of acetyl-CoA carboxylase n=1 Tax=Thioflexithrix psekupsensis TaxID=1570016 RepID=A0A251X4I6_9GAMM|nr:acetyl-CoA carboxylase biotin carboxyl carrier protein [Thioflexithrix psekupsensis]OUD12109.1 acetyl-CoA carboxylase, biotin carboxyl carrier protein [Thioflexithrix psekupsensis]